VAMVAGRNSFDAYKVFGWQRLFCEPERGAGTRRLVPWRRCWRPTRLWPRASRSRGSIGASRSASPPPPIRASGCGGLRLHLLCVLRFGAATQVPTAP